MTDRRDFLKKIAKTTVYAAPIIKTLAAPDALLAGGGGQGFNTEKGGTMGGGGGNGKGKSNLTVGSGFTAPWARD